MQNKIDKRRVFFNFAVYARVFFLKNTFISVKNKEGEKENIEIGFKCGVGKGEL